MKSGVSEPLRIFISMFFVSIGCRILGFLRQILLAKYFGTGDIVDSYVLAQSIPNILFGGVLVAFGSSYMPLLSKRYEKNGLEEANRYTSRVFIILFALSTVVAILGSALSPQITSIMAGGLNQNAKKIVSLFLKFTFGYTFFAATVGIYSNYLHYKGTFTKQIIGDYIQNIFFILFIWLAHKFNHTYIILGIFFGYFGRWIYLSILAYRDGFRFSFQIKGISEDICELKKYAIPIFIGTTANEINAFVDRSLASSLDSGSVSSLNYAHQLSTMCIELTATILATIIFPKLVQSFESNEIYKYKQFTKRGIIICSMVSIPIMITSIVFSKQIIEIIFERGQFSGESTLRTASAFCYYSIGMFALALSTLMGKVFYAARDMKTPMFCAIVGVIINIIGDIVLVKIMSQNGLALATSIANIINVLILCAFYGKGKYGPDSKTEYISIAKIVIASIVSVLIGYIENRLLNQYFMEHRRFLIIAVCISIAVIYTLFLIIFKVKEFEEIIRNEKQSI